MSDQNLFSFIIIAILAILFLALALLLIFNMSERRILNEVAEGQEMEIRFQKQVVESVIEAQEKERRRIARELHDDIGSKLNVINLNFNLLEGQLPKDKETERLTQSIFELLTASIEQTRNLSHQLLPPILEKFGLNSAINNLAGQLTSTKALQVDLDLNHDWASFSRIDELYLFRILQELINNTLRYAEASRISIRSYREGDQAELIYSDNGKGIYNFDSKHTGLGIQNILSRAKLLNAKIEFITEENEGFEVRLRFDIDNHQKTENHV